MRNFTLIPNAARIVTIDVERVPVTAQLGERSDLFGLYLPNERRDRTWLNVGNIEVNDFIVDHIAPARGFVPRTNAASGKLINTANTASHHADQIEKLPRELVQNALYSAMAAQAAVSSCLVN